MSSQLILIIDSDPVDHNNLIEQMTEPSYRLLSAYTGDEGIMQAITHQPDLILLDAMLPGKNGYEVCRILRNHTNTSDIPIIMLSRLRDVSYRIHAIEAGADEILRLPNNREELLVRVRGHLRLRESRKKLAIERSNLHLLSKIDQAVMQRIDLDALIHTIIEETQKALGANEGVLIIMDKMGQPIRRIVRRENGDSHMFDLSEDRDVMRSGFAGWIWENETGAVIADVRWDDRWLLLENGPQAGSAVGVPLFHVDKTLYGVMVFSHKVHNFFDSNHLTLLVMIANQVTAALQNAQLYTAVRDEQEKLTTILAKTNDAIITIDQDKRIERLNQAAGEMLGTSLEEVYGRLLSEVAVFASIEPLVSWTQPTTAEHRLEDGRYLLISMSPIPDVGMVIVIQDTTVQRQREVARYQQLEETFKPYVGSSLYELAIGNTDDRMRKDAVILFADLRNHTQLVSACKPGEAIAVLNRFFDEMTKVVHQYNGVIIDLIGDELEVCFNVHESQPDAPIRAVRTAIAMQERFNDLRDQFRIQPVDGEAVELGLGIGIDIGDVLVGQVGSQSRKNLALVGRAVNAAHRMVDMAQDGYVVIGRHFHQLFAAKHRPLAQLFGFGGMTPIKGLDEPVAIMMAYIKPELESELLQLDLDFSELDKAQTSGDLAG